MRATPLLIAIATLLSLTFASALPTAESNIPIPSSTLRTHIRAASTPPPAATPANAAATPAATGATCFDDGDCILSVSFRFFLGVVTSGQGRIMMIRW
ncbi:uncharacterized protein BKA78DRAFT_381262 [Phyllosticta capitalensis]|uniref:uncharacterized protein n=1 Tax=Phyllosticta capitalensis TaxID=121624 RepID=UPI00312FD2B4